MTGAMTRLPWQVLDDYHCFGCSPHNVTGLQLAFTEHPDGLVTRFDLGRAYESYPGVVHGGLLAVICDETMGNLVVLRTGLVAFTTGMRMRYLEPVTTGATHSCVARLLPRRAGGDGVGAGLVHTGADILDDAGRLVAGCTASYRSVPLGAALDRIALDTPQADRLDRALSDAVSEEP